MLALLSREQEVQQRTDTRSADIQDSITWSHIEGIARYQLQDSLKELEGDVSRDRKLIKEVYVPREDIEGENGLFKEFLASGKPILPILGESGHGKTNLMCSLTRHPSLEEYTVLFYEGRNLRSGFADQFQRDLNTKVEPKEIIRELSAGSLAGKKLLIFLDGVNEYKNPEELVHEIISICNDQSTDPAFRIVLSCRTIIWSRIHISLSSEEDSALFYVISGGKKQHASLSAFTEEELATAYSFYAKAYGLKTAYGALSAGTRDLLRACLES